MSLKTLIIMCWDAHIMTLRVDLRAALSPQGFDPALARPLVQAALEAKFNDETWDNAEMEEDWTPEHDWDAFDASDTWITGLENLAPSVTP